MLHLLKYSLKQMIRRKECLFWGAVFPLLLATFLTLSLSGVDSESGTQAIACAVVASAERDEEFQAYLEKFDGDLLAISYMEENEAIEALEKNDISGIIYSKKQPELTVTTTGISESVLRSLLDIYMKNAAMIKDIAGGHPERLETAVKELSDYKNYISDVNISGKSSDETLVFFFALIAMACLYGCFNGHQTASEMKANMSSLGARRCVTPLNRMKLVISDLIVTFLIQIVNVMILILYMRFGLKVEMTDNWAAVLLICCMGSVIGCSMGILIGSIGRISSGYKEGIMIGISMICSFAAGLMVEDTKYVIERSMPVLNRINPAALISDAFYCLSVYDNPGRYTMDIILLAVFSVVMVSASFLVVRRERYESL